MLHTDPHAQMPLTPASMIREAREVRVPADEVSLDLIKTQLGRMSENFVGFLCLLAQALGYTRAHIANMLMAGRQKELVAAMTNKLNARTGIDLTEVTPWLMAQAEHYQFPEKYARDRTALLKYMHIQTGKISRKGIDTPT